MFITSHYVVKINLCLIHWLAASAVSCPPYSFQFKA
uniref:Uncharacterized protein n=1 Tax=Anguilla anguilla TaxID=7936 RepID=A0A0E9U838_ANGAN